MDASLGRVAGIGSALIIVVAVLGQTRLTGSVGTEVAHCTEVVVVAGKGIGTVEASVVHVASIGRAGIVVLTCRIRKGRSCAGGPVANIAFRARIAIVTGVAIGRTDTPFFRVTTVCCAGIVIVAIRFRDWRSVADPVFADVGLRAGIAIIASDANGFMEAS